MLKAEKFKLSLSSFEHDVVKNVQIKMCVLVFARDDFIVYYDCRAHTIMFALFWAVRLSAMMMMYDVLSAENA